MLYLGSPRYISVERGERAVFRVSTPREAKKNRWHGVPWISQVKVGEVRRFLRATINTITASSSSPTLTQNIDTLVAFVALAPPAPAVHGAISAGGYTAP